MVEVGDKAPEVEPVDTERVPVRISIFRGKPTVLLFTLVRLLGVGTKEMCTMRDSLAEYNKLNANVVGISVDGPVPE